ncbi:tRNA 2-thiouridine(34) synthase MnmA [Pelagibaculum spongiae]|uniref:tRNA-specific 2-thiouridylase MnmA n=1 Tax=Pelagibaculum spongiae TaxID=2080658 RepID=A0A2V1H2Q5_9GAMM|nr:tRNA 2-thiouridine(34) synthase MnmA [Pelagibaculum spongiae]PVZ71498.1 tRNA 2-thiouridine(34) synthase MnmA [Pelagibaculum spongiae]
MSRKKVIIGMSGGVDSSVSALLLKQAGYEVHGLFMKNWEEDDTDEYCSATTDLSDARAVCEKIDIPLHTINFAAEYWDNVFDHFLDEYRAGRTPNPDILCNKEIKFRAFLDHAIDALGADYIATGHYVRRGNDAQGKACLLRGLDNNKDQSYFLHALSSDQLEKVLFPVGELEKPKVRELALEHDLITHNKKDSTGICFIGERRFTDFLKKFIPAQPGEIITPEGDVIGKHEGLMYYTLGQRQGLGIGGMKDSSDEPWFAATKDLENNRLTAVQGHNHPLLMSKGLIASKISWVNVEQISYPLRCTAKTRYRQPDQACTVELEGDNLRVVFDEQQRAVTPGQSVVFYLDDQCLGGSVIAQHLQD